MKLYFLRTGGFAGIRLSLVVDTDELPEEDASRIRRLVEASGFSDLDAHEVRASPAVDRFEYRLAIRSQVLGDREFLFAESAVPDEMRPLLAHLTAMALSRQAPDDGR